MGMGEPLLNYENVLKAINILSDKNNGLLNRKKITLSTAGIVRRIYDLADTQFPVKLAISLHATNNKLRSKLMPLSKTNSISKILDAVEYYYRKTKMKITFEYILFDGLNDSFEDARRLSKLAKRIPSRVNIIPFNDITFTQPMGLSAELKPATNDKLHQFAEWLRSMNVPAIVRDTFGSDIEAACGQLALADKIAESIEYN
jgi:23S rRNA (adenine2503-C2)-methyltransferase